MGRNARNARAKPRRSRTASSSTGRLGSFAAGIAVVAAAVFALGLELGARRDPRPELPADRLSLLDEVDRAAPPAPAPATLVFHNALTMEQPPETLPSPATRPPQKAPKRSAPPAEAKPGPVVARASPPAPPRPPPRIENQTWKAGVGLSPEGRWAIQLGASPNEAEARKIAARHPGSRIETADVDGKRWYRVRLAGFRSKGDAEAEVERLAREGGTRGFVVAAR
jgi:cell division septation protein DedD